MRRAFATVANDLLETDKRIAVTLADIGVADFPPSDRVINVGIREQALIGVTAGLSLAGLRPYAHSYAPFLVERPFEQIKLDLGHQGLGAVLVSTGASFDAAAEGRTHQAPGDIALLASLPDWTIHVPGHSAEVEEMMRTAAKTDDRIYIRLAADTNSQHYPCTGKLTSIRTGSAHGSTVIAVGPMLDRVLSATAGLDLTVLYASTVRPFDRRGLSTAARGGSVILVEPYNEGTSAAEITTGLADRPIRLLSIGVQNEEHRRYGTRHHHARAHGLDPESIRNRIVHFVDTA